MSRRNKRNPCENLKIPSRRVPINNNSRNQVAVERCIFRGRLNVVATANYNASRPNYCPIAILLIKKYTEAEKFEGMGEAVHIEASDHFSIQILDIQLFFFVTSWYHWYQSCRHARFYNKREIFYKNRITTEKTVQKKRLIEPVQVIREK